MDSEEFARILAGVRAGDEAAATQLVCRYEPLIRRVARMRLRSTSLQRWFDSLDIWQSIMLDFLRGLKEDQFRLGTPQDLANLLTTMTCNKIVTKVRKNYKDERNLSVRPDVPDPAPTPSNRFSDQELVAMARDRLTDYEYRLFVARHVEGRSWEEIASVFRSGSTADAMRMQLARALLRARRELEMEGGSHDG